MPNGLEGLESREQARVDVGQLQACVDREMRHEILRGERSFA